MQLTNEKNDHTATQSRAAEYAKTIEELQGRLERMTTNYMDLQNAQPLTETEKTKLRSRISELESALEPLRTENAKLSTSVKHDLTRILELEADKSRLKAEVMRLKEALEAQPGEGEIPELPSAPRENEPTCSQRRRSFATSPFSRRGNSYNGYDRRQSRSPPQDYYRPRRESSPDRRDRRSSGDRGNPLGRDGDIGGGHRAFRSS
jgi:septal ring factor EnvC (AmiA/AmiB activator)